MNSDFVPTTAEVRVNFLFSSNASSKGIHFDLEPRLLVFLWNKETGSFSHGTSSFENAQSIRNRLFEVNTDCDEKGPYSVHGKLLFSQDCGGNHQIFSAEFVDAESFNQVRAEVSRVRLLDPNSNEMYPSFYGKNYVKDSGIQSEGKPEKLLFSSDKDGAFDIYEIDLPANQDLTGFLKSDREKSA